MSNLKITDQALNVPKANAIVDSIDELETLIADTKLPPRLHPAIPVLHDVIDAAEVRNYMQAETRSESSSTPTDTVDGISPDKLNQLVDTVDQKLSSELDSLVNVLKKTIKESIMDELKQELKKEATQTESSVTNEDNSSKPPE